jgi:repressor LexA
MKKRLTLRQQAILEFIRSSMQEKGAPPTLREIGKRFGISSTNGVRCFLTALEKKGMIRRASYRSRGIELVEGPLTVASLTAVPIVGRVAAGEPILAEENLEGHIGLDRELLRGEDLFALRVRGDSMMEAGIFDGDWVFARKQAVAERGEIVVAIIGEEATVKYYYPDNGRIRLEPANPAFRTIIIERNAPGFSLAGKVVGVFRKY